MLVERRCRTACENVLLVSDPSTANVVSSASTLTMATRTYIHTQTLTSAHRCTHVKVVSLSLSLTLFLSPFCDVTASKVTAQFSRTKFLEQLGTLAGDRSYLTHFWRRIYLQGHIFFISSRCCKLFLKNVSFQRIWFILRNGSFQRVWFFLGNDSFQRIWFFLRNFSLWSFWFFSDFISVNLMLSFEYTFIWTF